MNIHNKDNNVVNGGVKLRARRFVTYMGLTKGSVLLFFMITLGIPISAQAEFCVDTGGGGYNTVTVVNCTKGDGVSSGDNDIGVLNLTVKSYNLWDEDMNFAFTAVGQTGVVQDVDPGDEATVNCLRKQGVLTCDSYKSCRVKVIKTSFPDSVAILEDGKTYYFSGLGVGKEGIFSTTRPVYCD